MPRILNFSLFVFILLVIRIDLVAQENSFSVGSVIATGDKTSLPFWMRSNKFGDIPSAGSSISIVFNAKKDYDADIGKLLDWSVDISGRGGIGNKNSLLLTEGAIKLRIKAFELKVGRLRDNMGLTDTLLTSGSFSLSGNALGVPKVQVALSNYVSVPFTKDVFAIKGNFSHGWLGEIPIQFGPPSSTTGYLHEKTAFIRFGKPNWRIKLYGGINQVVKWANESAVIDTVANYSDFNVFMRVFTGVNTFKIAHVGNQVGSIDVGFEYDFNKTRVLLYRQNFYDKGALYYLQNVQDGLNGVSITRLEPSKRMIYWKRFLLEALFTKNQAGESWSKWTPSGPEYYYNHTVYSEGHSYKGAGLGTPFITTNNTARDGLARNPRNFFINNRLFLIHTGIHFSVYKWDHVLKLSFSENFGTYSTGGKGYQWILTERIYNNVPFGEFGKKKQFSGFIGGNKEVKKGLNVGYELAWDKGAVLKDNFGVSLKLTKTFKGNSN